MGDSDLGIWLAVCPLAIIVLAMVATVVALRARRRGARVGAGIVLIVFGAAMLLPGLGLLLSAAFGLVMIALGVALIIAEYRRGSAA